jgi:ABC-type multidrug transport system fused ATPase/permease subunit
MVIEKGIIVEYAPRAELAANPNSQFAQLLQHDLGMVDV